MPNVDATRTGQFGRDVAASGTSQKRKRRVPRKDREEPDPMSKVLAVEPQLGAGIAVGTYYAQVIVELTRRRQLLADGVPVELSTRGFDLLMILLEAAESLVTKDELMSRAWPNTIVEENNLHVQMSSLRKALAPERDLIRTEFGRGYRFTGAVRSTGPEAVSAPVRHSALIEKPIDQFASVLDLLRAGRTVTLKDFAGSAKTHVRLEIALRLLPITENGEDDA